MTTRIRPGGPFFAVSSVVILPNKTPQGTIGEYTTLFGTILRVQAHEVQRE